MFESIAHRIAAECQGASAYTLYGGYAVFLSGPRKTFPTGHQEMERRNEDGRCTAARYHYADGSRLHFTWHPMHGARLRAESPK
jgi:hypothetical protein